MNLLSIFFPQTVYKTSSKFSGEIKVIDHVFERRLVVGGLTQSGGITKKMWKDALSEFRIQSAKRADKIKNVLVLGFGAGTVAEVINKQWPTAAIVGVEIDPVIIAIGKKYFQLSDLKNLEIIIADAIAIINNGTMKQWNNEVFDLIIVDLYKGFFIEKNIGNMHFLQNLAKILAKNGIVIFNIVRRRNDNFEASIFLDKLRRIFQDNFCKRIITNDFFFCTMLFTKGGELSMAKRKKRKKR